LTVSSLAMDYYQAVESVLAVGSIVANGTSPVVTPYVPDMLGQMDPYFFGFLGAGLAVAVSVIGAAWYVLMLYYHIVTPFS
jgi:predicted outer membrane lipoprotein